MIRIPDAAFAYWERLPNRRMPTEPIPNLPPDLAVELLSESNTPAEMSRELRECIDAGVRLIWLVDHRTRTVTVHTSRDQRTVLGESETLDGRASPARIRTVVARAVCGLDPKGGVVKIV